MVERVVSTGVSFRSPRFGPNCAPISIAVNGRARPVPMPSRASRRVRHRGARIVLQRGRLPLAEVIAICAPSSPCPAIRPRLSEELPVESRRTNRGQPSRRARPPGAKPRPAGRPAGSARLVASARWSRQPTSWLRWPLANRFLARATGKNSATKRLAVEAAAQAAACRSRSGTYRPAADQQGEVTWPATWP